MMHRSTTAALLLVPIMSASAQDLGPPKEITSLGWMVGTWSGSGKIVFGGHSADITTTMTVSFDGQFLKAASVDKSAGFAMTKTSMTGWDAGKSQYVSYTFTNIAPMARIEHGKLDGSKLVMVADPWQAEGMKTITRETTSRISDTKCGLTLEVKKGDKWDKEMDFVLTKN